MSQNPEQDVVESVTKTEGENKMSKYESLTYAEKQECAELFAAWLKPYTHEVIVDVMEKADEIISNDFAMQMLRELHKRQSAEAERFKGNIRWLLDSFENFKKYNPHEHVLEHSGSYRDVLYDMYIADRKRDSKEE